jgi:hypothetical protein
MSTGNRQSGIGKLFCENKFPWEDQWVNSETFEVYIFLEILCNGSFAFNIFS